MMIVCFAHAGVFVGWGQCRLLVDYADYEWLCRLPTGMG